PTDHGTGPGKAAAKGGQGHQVPFFDPASSQASVRAMGMEAAVVFPYFMMLLYTLSSESPNFFWMNWEILRLAWWGMSRSISPLSNWLASKPSMMTSLKRTTAFLNTNC